MENLTWGLGITAVGMGLVFGLLTLLWGLLTIALRVDRPPAPTTSAPEVPAPAAPPGIAPEMVAAITVAVVAHIAARRREAAPLTRHYWPGSLLFASRWIDIGRSRQNHSWRRRGR